MEVKRKRNLVEEQVILRKKRKSQTPGKENTKGGQVKNLTKEILSLAKESHKNGSPSSWLSTFEKKLKQHLKPEEVSGNRVQTKRTLSNSLYNETQVNPQIKKQKFEKVSISPIPDKKSTNSSPWLKSMEASTLIEPSDTTGIFTDSESRSNSCSSAFESTKSKKRRLGKKMKNLSVLVDTANINVLKTPDNTTTKKTVFAKPAPRARSERKLRTPSFLREKKSKNTLDISDWDSDEEDLTGVGDPGYFHPRWAKREAVNTQLTKQSKLDPDAIFGRVIPRECDLAQIFLDSNSKYERTPSSKWTVNDRLTFSEESKYRKQMGFETSPGPHSKDKICKLKCPGN